MNKKELNERILKALEIAWKFGQIDGEHHKTWTIDQMVRALCGTKGEYEKWIEKYEAPLPPYYDDHYEWDTGITP